MIAFADAFQMLSNEYSMQMLSTEDSTCRYMPFKCYLLKIACKCYQQMIAFADMCLQMLSTEDSMQMLSTEDSICRYVGLQRNRDLAFHAENLAS